MASAVPISTLLSHALIAFTIELDNEFERRFEESGGGARCTSFVMWANLLRFVGDGIAVGELIEAVGLQKARMLSPIGGLERWRYTSLGPSVEHGPPAGKRDGYGSSRGIKSDWIVRLTPAGERAVAIWQELVSEIPARWRERFGDAQVTELERALRELAAGANRALPDFPPIVGSANGMALDLPERDAPEADDDVPLGTLLSHALLVHAVAFEAKSPLALTLSANLLRVLDENGVAVRDLPVLAGTSKEAVASALTSMAKTEYVKVVGTTVATKSVRLTPAGHELRDTQSELHAQVERELGRERVARARSALEAVLGHPDLAEGLRAPAGGWRASRPYAAQTERRLSDPRAELPHYPLVLHRGGWPDGS
jgi:hypothetical protein